MRWRESGRRNNQNERKVLEINTKRNAGISGGDLNKDTSFVYK